MISRVYISNKDNLFVALEDIFLQYKQDYFIKSFDFIIFSISSMFFPKDINPTIQKIFNTNNYIAFNAETSFSHNLLSNSITALFIKFENNAKIKIKNLNEVNFSKLNIILVPYENNKCICDLLRNQGPFIGGICSGDRAYIYFDNYIEKTNPIVLEFENIEYELGISLGYKPIGPTYKVHVSNKNKLYVVDYEDASLIGKKLLSNTNGDIKNLWFSPLLVISDKTGLVEVVRTFKDIKENYYIEFYGNIENKSNIKLSFATKEMLLEEDKKVALKVKEKISPELVFNFSCVAREYILDDKKLEENQIYSKILNAPIFGFFTYGEIGPDYKYKTSKLYNQTSLLLAIKEK